MWLYECTTNVANVPEQKKIKSKKENPAVGMEPVTWRAKSKRLTN
jgi:hypothetical protein